MQLCCVFVLVQFLLSQIQSTPYVEPASTSLTADSNVRNENNISPLLLLATRQELKKLQNVPRDPVIGTSTLTSRDSGKFKSNILLRNLHNVFAINFHYRKKLIFFPDNLQQTIMSVPFDDFDTKNNKIKTVIKHTVYVNGLACDWVTDKLYWTNRELKRIEVASMDGLMSKVLFWTDIDEPRAIALTPMKALMFWTDWGEVPKIEKAAMNGDPKTRTVVVNENIVWPNGLAIDLNSDMLYWSDGSLKSLSSTDFNGDNRKTILIGEKLVPYPFGVSVFNSKLFWTDWETKSVHFYDLNLNQSQRILYRSDSVPMDIKVWHESQQPNLQHPCQSNNGNCSHLCLLATNEIGYSCACPNTIKAIDNYTCASSPEEVLLVARKDSISLIYLDSDEFTIENLPLDNVKQAIAIGYDYNTNFIYWTDVYYKTIQKASLTSGYQETVLKDDIYSPDGLFIDETAGNMYWTDSFVDLIQVARLDGSYRRILIYDELTEPRAITVASKMGLMFWTDWNDTNPKIERAHLDGVNRTLLVTKDLVWPNGLDIDFETQRLYWCDASTYNIESVRFDGSDRQLLVHLKSYFHMFGVTVLGRYVYYTDWKDRSIGRIDKNLPGRPEFVTVNNPNLMGIKAINLKHKPDQFNTDNPCATNNGGCSHLCLSKPNNEYVCSCDMEYELLSDRKSCRLPDVSIFYVQNNMVGRLSIETKNENLEVPLSKVWQVKTFDMDPNTKTIYWSEDRQIMSTTLWGLDTKVFIEVDVNDVNGIAVDWISRNLFWTDSVTNRIQVVRMDGVGRKTLIWDDVHDPRHIVLDPFLGLIFWIESGSAKGCIKRAQMDGERIQQLDRNIGSGTALTIQRQEKRIFWNSVVKMDDFSFVKSCNYDGTDKVTVYESNGLWAPLILAAFGNHLYWTDSNSNSIWRGDLMSGNNRHLINSNVKNISALMVVATRFNRSSNLCSVNNGGCSHLCLMLSEKEYTCACPTHFMLMSNNSCLEPQHFLMISQKSLLIRLHAHSDDFLESIVPLSRLKNVRALDYDPFSNMIYWIEGRNPSIKRAFINDSLLYYNNEIVTLIGHSDANQPIDFEIDPLGDLIYWVCAKQKAIVVSRLSNGTFLGIVVGGSVEEKESPQMLALHLKKRLMIWTDKTNQSLLIRARMDGSYRVTIKRTMNEITAIAIDIETDTIIWAEDNLVFISNIEGENQYTILSETGHSITKIVALSGSIYWYDREQRQVQSQDLLIGGRSRATLFNHSVLVTDMVAINLHSYTSTCTSDNAPKCSYICIESQQRAVCGCPNGSALEDDEKTCTVIQECEANHFTCASTSPFNRDCIPSAWRCDGNKDCPDGSDEIGCPSCPHEKFQCPNGQCIDLRYVCDTIPHCSDAYDERHCCKSPLQFQCPHNGVCIDRIFLCDGLENCSDGADESKDICDLNRSQLIEASKISIKSTVKLTIIGLLITGALVILIPMFVLRIRRKMFKPRHSPSGFGSVPITLSNLQNNAGASEPLYLHQYAPRVVSMGMGARSHYPGRPSSTIASSSYCPTEVTIGRSQMPPPSPEDFRRTEYSYIPPCPSLNDVSTVSDYH